METKNTSKTEWDKILIGIIIIILLYNVYKYQKNRMIDNIMEDKEYREKMNINNREEAEENFDDYNPN